MAYQEVFQTLADIGLLDVILPFLLVFIITYSLLQRTMLFGVEGKEEKPKKKINAMVAFVMGFFAVLATNLLSTINILLNYMVLLLIVGLLLALVFGIAGGSQKSKLFRTIMLIFFVLFVLYALTQAGIIDASRLSTGTILLILAIIAGLAWLSFRSGGKEKEEKPREEKPKEESKSGLIKDKDITPKGTQEI